MALTAVTVFDIIGATQTITFNNPSQVDQITFSSNSITLQEFFMTVYMLRQFTIQVGLN